MSIGWGKPINKLANAVGAETKVETEEAPPPDVLDPGLPEPLQKLSVEAKASLQQVSHCYLKLATVGTFVWLCCVDWSIVIGVEELQLFLPLTQPQS